MNTRSCFASLLVLATVSPAVAQFYAISKNQQSLQTSASAVAADPRQPYYFHAIAASNASLTVPGQGSIPLQLSSDRENPYQLNRGFLSKAAMDAAFPNGTYQITGPGIPTLSLTMSSDAYPAAVPQVTGATNGTWTNGVLVINPSQPAIITFSTFSDYASVPIVAHVGWYVYGLMDQVSQDTDTFSRPGFGGTAQPAPPTSATIPAASLTAGRVYQAELYFDAAVAGDLTTIPGSMAAILFSRVVRFYVATQLPGTTIAAPAISAQPASQMATIGGAARFTVGTSVSSGNAPGDAFFQWWFNGEELRVERTGKYTSADNLRTLIVDNLTAADAGEYSVTIVNAGGMVHSASATLSFATASAPAITTQPRSATVNAGTTLALTVGATGVPTPTYQWRKDGANINGATSETLVLGNVTAASAGSYLVVVSNASGFVTSEPAVIVVTANQPSRLPNLSVRTNLGHDETLFVGFATSGAKTMLVRAVGPTLAGFGLDGTHPDPRVELYDSSSAKIDENNDWNSSLASVFQENGAFPLLAGSRDAALRRSCSGAYTVQIKGAGAGVLLVEAYDTGGTGKLVNVSARNFVGTDDNVLIAGFVVEGTAGKTLLIRGVGARLAELGVTDVLLDPKLEIYNAAGVKIAENDNWNSLLEPVATRVGGFPLTPNSRDAALLMTIAPGNYTAQVSGVGRTTGAALVEVYEVP